MGAADRILCHARCRGRPHRLGEATLDGTAPSIALKDVTFEYVGGRFVLQPLTGDIPSGAHIALVGASGSGKTTVLNVLSGLLKPQAVKSR